jgi:hypothetical protein
MSFPPLVSSQNPSSGVSSSDSPSQLNSIGKDPRGRPVTQNQEPSTSATRIKPSSLASTQNTPSSRIVQQAKTQFIAHNLFSASSQAENIKKDLSTQFKNDTRGLEDAQSKYNDKSGWAGRLGLRKTGLKIQSHWKNNAYAQKIDYQEKLTQEITNYAFQKSMGAKAFIEDNQNTIKQWLKGVEVCSARRQPNIIKLILSKVIQTGNPADVTPIKNWARQHLEGKIDPYCYANPQEQLQTIKDLTARIQNTTSKSEKSKLQNEFAEKLKYTFVKDEQTVNVLAGFIKECPSKVQPALVQSMHDQLQKCGAPTKLTNSLDHLFAALKSSS